MKILIRSLNALHPMNVCLFNSPSVVLVKRLVRSASYFNGIQVGFKSCRSRYRQQEISLYMKTCERRVATCRYMHVQYQTCTNTRAVHETGRCTAKTVGLGFSLMAFLFNVGFEVHVWCFKISTRASAGCHVPMARSHITTGDTHGG